MQVAISPHPVLTLCRFARWFSRTFFRLPRRVEWVLGGLEVQALRVLYPAFDRQCLVARGLARALDLGMEFLLQRVGPGRDTPPISAQQVLSGVIDTAEETLSAVIGTYQRGR
jgi:cobalamin biosynthesis protein CobD/CbiB